MQVTREKYEKLLKNGEIVCLDIHKPRFRRDVKAGVVRFCRFVRKQIPDFYGIKTEDLSFLEFLNELFQVKGTEEEMILPEQNATTYFYAYTITMHIDVIVHAGRTYDGRNDINLSRFFIKERLVTSHT